MIERTFGLRVGGAALFAVLVLGPGGGCGLSAPRVSPDEPQVAAMIELLAPREIEIQAFLTRPVSFGESGDADGLEVVLALRDESGSETKCVGVFLLELYERRPASGNPLGSRIGLWKHTVDSRESLQRCWDKLSGYFRFRLQLDEGRLPPGAYILQAQFNAPTGIQLVDQYSFDHTGGPAPRRSLP